MNTAAVAGQRVTLSCRRSSSSVVWNFTPVRASVSLTIVSDCQPLPSVSGVYRTESINGSCDLIIDHVTTDLAGTYSCQDMSGNSSTVASHLTVLGRLYNHYYISH